MDLQLGRGLNDALDLRKIGDAGQLHQDLVVTQAVLLDNGFRHAQIVDAFADGLDRLRQRACLNVANGGLFHHHPKAVRDRVHVVCGVGVAVEDVANRALLGRRYARYGDGIRMRWIHLGRRGSGSCQGRVQRLHVTIRGGVDGFGHVYLQHQVGAAAQIEPQVDAVHDRLLESAVGNPDDPVQKDHDDGDDEARFSG